MSQPCLKPLTSHLINDMPRGMSDTYPTRVRVSDTWTLHLVGLSVLPWGQLKYFLSIKVAQSNSDVIISQRKYTLDILEETSMLDCKSMDTPMNPNVKLVLGQGEPLQDPKRY